MPHRQAHRGRHPQDDRLFADAQLPKLRQAVSELSWLLTRGYAQRAALKLVGDHHQLAERQRRAVLGAACTDASLACRVARRVPDADLRGRSVVVDGYNLLISVEALFAGGMLLRGRDGCIRDLASLHGSYRKVEETFPALVRIGETLDALGVAEAHWRFDAPVSNSGRLKVLMEDLAREREWPWEIRLVRRTDQRIAASAHVVVTSDSWILDRAQAWYPVIDTVVACAAAGERVLELGTPSG